MKPGTKLGFLALALAVACVATWFYVNRTVGIPEDRTLFVIGFFAAAALGISAFVRGTRWYGGLAAAAAIVIGTFLPFTVVISPQQVGAESIRVGVEFSQFGGHRGGP
jgi:hypothetical protein